MSTGDPSCLATPERAVTPESATPQGVPAVLRGNFSVWFNRDVSIAVPGEPGSTETTRNLVRQDGRFVARSRMQDAVVTIDYGVAVAVWVADLCTLFPWSAVESISWRREPNG